MTTMNEQECIIKLLESLGIGARKISNDILEIYMLECSAYEYAYIGGAHHFSGYENILMWLMNSLRLSYFKSNCQKLYHAKNPYYGCKSLEEALVKKDLLGIN